MANYSNSTSGIDNITNDKNDVHTVKIATKNININKEVDDQKQSIPAVISEDEHSSFDSSIINESHLKYIPTEKAEEISQDPHLFLNAINMVNRLGVSGERKNIAIYLCTINSRLLKKPFAIKNAGHYGAGKSHTLDQCLKIQPESAYYRLTDGSEKSLFYIEGGLKHKCMVLAEGVKFQKNKLSADRSTFAYVIRTLLSEGHARYLLAGSGGVTGGESKEVVVNGPVSFITTTTHQQLESQLEDRMFTIYPDDSMEQTRDVILNTALINSGEIESPDENEIQAWRYFHEKLKPVNVIIPYLEDVAVYIMEKNPPLATRRAFNKLISVISSIACIYQNQREIDKNGRIIADLTDYHYAYQVCEEAFRVNLKQKNNQEKERITFIRENGLVQLQALSDKEGVTKSALSQFFKRFFEDGQLLWCNKDGKEVGPSELSKLKRKGKAYIKYDNDHFDSNNMKLPTIYELTTDPRWQEGGELYEKSNLFFEARGSFAIKTEKKENQLAVSNHFKFSSESKSDFSDLFVHKNSWDFPDYHFFKAAS